MTSVTRLDPRARSARRVAGGSRRRGRHFLDLPQVSEPPPSFPSNVDDLRRMLAFWPGQFPKRMARAGQYLLDHPEIVAFGTVAVVAGAANVAPSTLVRFGQALGLGGFSGLQRLFRDDLLRRSGSGSNATAVGHKQRVRGVIARLQTGLDAFARTVDARTLDVFLSVAVSAETIFIVAKGRSFPIAVMLSHMLNRARIRTQLAIADQFSGGDILALSAPGDALIEMDTCESELGVLKGSILVSPMKVGEHTTNPDTVRGNCLLTIPDCSGVVAIALCVILTESIVERRLGAVGHAI